MKGDLFCPRRLLGYEDSVLNKIEFLPLRSLDVGGILQREPGLDSPVTHIRMEHVWRKAERNLERPE